MRFKPAGYYVKINVEEVEQVSDGGIITATATELSRQQGGHDVGVLEAIGPTAFCGMNGIDDSLPVLERAKLYGVEIGDLVQFTRYDGAIPRHEEEGHYRIIEDQHVKGPYTDD